MQDVTAWTTVGVAAVGAVFNVGMAYAWVRDLRREQRSLRSEMNIVKSRQEKHYREILVVLTAITAALPQNPGVAKNVLEMLQRMARESSNLEPETNNA